MKYTTQNVYDLSTAKLNWVVARCEGFNPQLEDGDVWLYPKQSTMPITFTRETTTSSSRVVSQQFNPADDWYEGGEIIHRENLGFTPIMNGESEICGWICTSPSGITAEGTTHLIAAMRCYVISKLGREVYAPS
jgi:hypothetical protein